MYKWLGNVMQVYTVISLIQQYLSQNYIDHESSTHEFTIQHESWNLHKSLDAIKNFTGKQIW